MPALQKISIIGSGSWATALVKIFSESGIRVTWNLRSTAHVEHILEYKRPPHYLTHLSLDLQFIQPVASLEAAIGASDHILIAVPSAYLAGTVAGYDQALPEGKKLLVSVKGIIPETSELPTHFLGRHFQVPPEEIMVVGGPCHAEEVSLGRRTYMTIAGNDLETVQMISESIRSPYLKVLVNNDPLGVELAAIMKNVVGIAAGITRGMNNGDNFLAVIVSNALREIGHLLNALSPRPRDLNDSAYYGDLLVTAYSSFSRNNVFGQLIGRGYSVSMAKARMQMVAEGYPAAKGLFRLAESSGLQLPLLSAVYRILYRQSSTVNEMRLLEQYLR